MTRNDAIDRMVSESFLPIDKAECVIDAVFAETGVYNPKSSVASEVIDPAEMVAGCTELDPEVDEAERDRGAVSFTVKDVDTTPEEPEGPYELTTENFPAITPGGLAIGSVKLKGTNVDYVAITPAGFTAGSVAPVLLAFPPGGQDLQITRAVADFVYRQQAVQRGWVVVTPASPGGNWHDRKNAALVPEMLRWIDSWVTSEGGRPHLGGMSNGGQSAFRIAAQSPSAFRSIMAYPGYPTGNPDTEAIIAAGIPIRMWVGGDDPPWRDAMKTSADFMLRGGADVQLTVLPGEPHVLQSTSDGVAIFNQLDAAR